MRSRSLPFLQDVIDGSSTCTPTGHAQCRRCEAFSTAASSPRLFRFFPSVSLSKVVAHWFDMDYPLQLLSQGAEARVYTSVFNGQPCIVKERFKKEYRHPVLDEKLTKERLVLEARNLVRARKAGVLSPLPYFVDASRGHIFMERVHGVTVKQWLLSKPAPAHWKAVAHAIGSSIALLHAAGIIHGDLTTSNMMLQGHPHAGALTAAQAAQGASAAAVAGMAPLPGEYMSVSEAAFASSLPTLPYPLVLIDFGLSAGNASVEDRGVDLYVLERALASTHAECAQELFEVVLEGYQSAVLPPGAPQAPGKDRAAVLAKFQQVRLRGRKRLAFG